MLEDTDNDKLAKVRYLYNVIKFKCRELYQPSNNISIDETRGITKYTGPCPHK